MFPYLFKRISAAGFLVVHTVGPQKDTSVVHDLDTCFCCYFREQGSHYKEVVIHGFMKLFVKGSGKVTKRSHMGDKTTVLFWFWFVCFVGFFFTSRQISFLRYAAFFSKGSFRL